MGLATRVIPVILCRGRQMVKGKRFESWRSVGLAAQSVRIHQSRGVDELVLLDISATHEGRGPDLDLVRELSESCFMPLSVGGGISNIKHAKELLRAGADKLVIGTAGPTAIREISNAIGAQAIIASIDYREDGQTRTRSGTQPTGHSVLDLSRICEDSGAGEILLTAIEREGEMQGYDLETIKAVSAAVSIPVIAHGGCGTYEHMHQAIKAGASAVAAGSIFLFEDATPRGACEYLGQHNVEVRL